MSGKNRLVRADVCDVDIVDQIELASIGATVYKIVPLTSTTAGTKTIVVTQDTLNDSNLAYDTPVEAGDIISITGNAAAGIYTVDVVVDSSDLTVEEDILDSTDGYAAFIYPTGSSRVGYPPTGTGMMPAVTIDDVRDALDYLDGYALDDAVHEGLNTLVHNIARTSFDEVVYGAGNRIDSVTTYTSAAKTQKIQQSDLSYSGTKISEVVTQQFDNTGLFLYSVTEAPVYSGNQITSVTRTRSGSGLSFRPGVQNVFRPSSTNKDMVCSVTVADGDSATAIMVVLDNALDSMVQISVNGTLQVVGDGTKVGVDVYISGDAGLTAQAMSEIRAGDTFHWNGSVAGFQLSATDRISLYYMVF